MSNKLTPKQLALVESVFKASKCYRTLDSFLSQKLCDGGITVEDDLKKSLAEMSGTCGYCSNPMRCMQCEQDTADYMETIISASRS